MYVCTYERNFQTTASNWIFRFLYLTDNNVKTKFVLKKIRQKNRKKIKEFAGSHRNVINLQRPF